MTAEERALLKAVASRQDLMAKDIERLTRAFFEPLEGHDESLMKRLVHMAEVFDRGGWAVRWTFILLGGIITLGAAAKIVMDFFRPGPPT